MLKSEGFTSSTMERAGRLLGKLKLPQDVLEPGAMACSAWPAAVGKRIAARTKAIRVVRTSLIVECEDLIWQKQLHGLRGAILKNLANLLGEGVVTSLDLRPMTPRRGMQTATQLRPFALGETAQQSNSDEADRIQDPVFRLLYKQSRRKAAAPAASLDGKPQQAPLFEYQKNLSDTLHQTKKKASA